MRHRFGDFVADDATRRLTRADGTPVPVAPRLFDALLFFVSHPGRLLDKDTLLTALSPGLIVEENSLNQTVLALRRLLGDDAQASRYIQTVPRRGFRFVAEVAAVAGPPADPAEVPAPPPQRSAVATESSPDAPLAVPPASPSRRRLVVGAGAGAMLAVAAGAWWWRRGATHSAPALATLAVLPFRPLVAEASDPLLEFGMADSLITRLSNLPGVAVRSVGSVRRFSGLEQDPLAAARELDVQWIVDGSIQRWGDQVRVTARLLDTRAGEAAWSGNFDERFTGVFDLQDAISSRVAAVLAPHIQARTQKRLAGAGGTRDVDAYQFYLAARQQAEAVRAAGLARSVDLYGKAIAIDPSYALAHVGIAESYRRMIFGADAEPSVVFPAGARALQRAIAIDPGLSEAQSGLGWQRYWFDWDWSAAEATFRQAIAMNASDASAHFGYGQLLDSNGREAESVEQMRFARELDPLSPITLTLEASALFWSKDRGEGRRRLDRVFDLDPDFWVAHLALGSMLIADKKIGEGIASFERADRLADGSSQAAMALGYVLARNGQPERARAILDRLVATARERYVPPTAYGLIHAGLGQTAQALDALEAALAVRDTRMTLMRADTRWKRAVGDEPRYRAVIAKMRFG